MKTKKTKEIENYLYLFLQKKGTFCCPEVKMGMGNTGKHGIVDYLSLTTKGIVTCYEIKVTKEDLVNSSHGHNFYGNYNFYVIPIGLYLKIKDFVPKYVGVIGFDIEGHAKYLKEAKFMTIRNLSSIKLYLIRSLYREFQKTMSNKLHVNTNIDFQRCFVLKSIDEKYMYAKPVKVLVKKYKADGAYIIEYENGKKQIISEEELFRKFETRWE